MLYCIITVLFVIHLSSSLDGQRSALAFLLPFVGAGLTIVSGVQLYISGADDADRVWHIYYIIVLVLDSLFNDGEEAIIDVSVLDGGSLKVRHISMALAPLLCFFL